MINVLYFFNDKYAPYAGVSIVSLLENNKTEDKIRVFMLGEDVSQENQDKIVKQVQVYGREAVYIDAKEHIEELKRNGINEYRGAYAPNLKLVVSRFLPQDVRRILYLDCDTIVNGSLHYINELNMMDKPLAMCMDSVCKEHKREIGFKEEEPYFNSGVILYDVDKFRENRCAERMIEHLVKERCHYMAPDQDVINIVLKDEIVDMGMQYNLQPMHSVYSYRQYNRYFGQKVYYTQEQIENAVSNPVIYHTFRYLGAFPWHKNSMHPNEKLFDKYMLISEWADYEKKMSERNDFVFRVERKMYQVLPRSIFVIIFKCCYEIFMWKSAHDSEKGKNNIRM